MGAIALFVAFILSIWFDWNVCAFVLFVALVLWLVMFRNPERIPHIDENNVFVSPVDGIVRDMSYSNDEMSILIETRFIDVGIIRAPCDIVEGQYSEKKGLSLTCCAKAKCKELNATMRFESLKERAFYMEFYPIFFSSHHLFAQNNLSIGERIGFMKAGMTRIVIPQKKASIEFESKEIGRASCRERV